MRVNWQEVCEEISTNYFEPQFHIEVADGPYGVQYLFVKRFVRDIENGKRKAIPIVVPVIEVESELAAVAYIYQIMNGNLSHEFAEHFRFRGKRIFAPRH